MQAEAQGQGQEQGQGQGPNQGKGQGQVEGQGQGRADSSNNSDRGDARRVRSECGDEELRYDPCESLGHSVVKRWEQAQAGDPRPSVDWCSAEWTGCRGSREGLGCLTLQEGGGMAPSSSGIASGESVSGRFHIVQGEGNV